MRRKKKNESIWHYMTINFGDFTMPKVKLWYEFVPGFAFRAIWFGRQRKLLGRRQYLVLYRDNINDKCSIEWIFTSKLTERGLHNFDKFYNTGLKRTTFINPNTDTYLSQDIMVENCTLQFLDE